MVLKVVAVGVNDATAGAVRSITVLVTAAVSTDGYAAPSTMTAPGLRLNSTVPAVVDAPPTVTVYGPAPEPLSDCTLHPVAVPPTANFAAVSPVGTLWNMRVNVVLLALVVA